MHKFNPLGTYLLVKVDRPAAQSAGGVWLPETKTKEPPTRGSVVKAGPLAKKTYGIEGNEYIQFIPGTGMEIDDDHHVIQASAVQCVLENPRAFSSKE